MNGYLLLIVVEQKKHCLALIMSKVFERLQNWSPRNHLSLLLPLLLLKISKNF